jgi:holo-[acyl-carrier protein] synthase
MTTAFPIEGGTARPSAATPGAATDVLDAATLATGQLVRTMRGDGSGPVPVDRAPALRVGVDLVAVEDIVASVQRFGDRYVRRIFTAHEIACCLGPEPVGPNGHPERAHDGYAYESLAARFAAKEATIKVLRPEGPRPEWRSIEVHREGNGSCELRLSGLAADLADQAGIEQLAVSLTHEASMGVAVVVATGSGHHQDVHSRGPRTGTLPPTGQQGSGLPQG